MTRARALGVASLVLACLAANACSPHAGGDAARGAALFTSGVSTRGTSVRVRLEDGSLEDAAAFPCARCHDSDARGAREGALFVPALVGLGAEDLETAVLNGINSHGRPLSMAMPRYRMTTDDLHDLAAHLRAVAARNHASVPRETTVTLVLPAGPERQTARAAFVRALDAFSLDRRAGLTISVADIVHPATDSDGPAGWIKIAPESAASPLAVLVDSRVGLNEQMLLLWEEAGVVVVLAGEDTRLRHGQTHRAGSVFTLGLTSSGTCAARLDHDPTGVEAVVAARQVEVLVQGIAHAGFRVSRNALVGGLEQVHLDPTTVLPAVRFGRRVRSGCFARSGD